MNKISQFPLILLSFLLSLLFIVNALVNSVEFVAPAVLLSVFTAYLCTPLSKQDLCIESGDFYFVSLFRKKKIDTAVFRISSCLISHNSFSFGSINRSCIQIQTDGLCFVRLAYTKENLEHLKLLLVRIPSSEKLFADVEKHLAEWYS